METIQFKTAAGSTNLGKMGRQRTFLKSSLRRLRLPLAAPGA